MMLRMFFMLFMIFLIASPFIFMAVHFWLTEARHKKPKRVVVPIPPLVTTRKELQKMNKEAMEDWEDRFDPTRVIKREQEAVRIRDEQLRALERMPPPPAYYPGSDIGLPNPFGPPPRPAQRRQERSFTEFIDQALPNTVGYRGRIGASAYKERPITDWQPGTYQRNIQQVTNTTVADFIQDTYGNGRGIPSQNTMEIFSKWEEPL